LLEENFFRFDSFLLLPFGALFFLINKRLQSLSNIEEAGKHTYQQKTSKKENKYESKR